MNRGSIWPESSQQFAEHRKRWIEFFVKSDGSGEPNLLGQQVLELNHDASLFRAFAFARDLAPTDDRHRRIVPTTFANLLDRSFYRSHVMRLRSIVGGVDDRHTGKRGVFALRALLADIRAHQPLFTRNNFAAVYGLPCRQEDIDAARPDRFDNEESRANFGIRVIKYEWFHAAFDKLSNTTNPQMRRPDDLLSGSVLDRLDTELSSVDRVAGHANKFVAHLATTDSRATEPLVSTPLAWNELWEATDSVIRVWNFVYSHVLELGTGYHVNVDFAYDLWRYSDAPLIASDALPQVRARFQKLREEALLLADPDWVWNSTATPNR